MKLVVRIGGSVVASPPNPVILTQYADLLKQLKKQGHQFVAVVGGGTIARDFIKIAKDTGLSEPEQDEIAVMISRVLARLLGMKLGKLALKTVPTSIATAIQKMKMGKIVVMGGLRPGMTTDAVAAMVAERMGADLLVKATDQDGIFARDPKKFCNVEKIDKISFDELFELFEENKHRAGIHQILDPEAVRILQKSRMKTVVVNGFNPSNIVFSVRGEKVGTIIE